MASPIPKLKTQNWKCFLKSWFFSLNPMQIVLQATLLHYESPRIFVHENCILQKFFYKDLTKFLSLTEPYMA